MLVKIGPEMLDTQTGGRGSEEFLELGNFAVVDVTNQFIRAA